MRRLLCTIALACPSVAATPLAACELRNVTSVNFGVYDVFSSVDDDSTGSVRVRCTPSTIPYTLKLSAGNSGRFSQRVLTSAGDRLNYNLYMDAARTRIWGDGTDGSSVESGNTRKTFTIYGGLPAGQDPTVGAYSESIVILVEF